MAQQQDKLAATVHALLTPAERANAVVYAMREKVPSGSKLQFPRLTIEPPWPAFIAFVDREPRANWGHSSRYLLINAETSDARSVEARFPPFQEATFRQWRVLYQAPGVPDSVLAIPKR
jgi:hypothetical protein